MILAQFKTLLESETSNLLVENTMYGATLAVQLAGELGHVH